MFSIRYFMWTGAGIRLAADPQVALDWINELQAAGASDIAVTDKTGAIYSHDDLLKLAASTERTAPTKKRTR